MNAPSDRQLQKVTMNFYREDIKALVEMEGNGWTGVIRELVRNYVICRGRERHPQFKFEE